MMAHLLAALQAIGFMVGVALLIFGVGLLVVWLGGRPGEPLVCLGLVLTLNILLTGCGFYIHRGGGAYTFIGPGAKSVANRCSGDWAYGMGRASGLLECAGERLDKAIKELRERE